MKIETLQRSAGRPDVLVIGAGLVGAACAWHLAAQGLQVEVIEARGVGGGATAEGMGHLVVMDDSPAQLALTRWSLELWRDLMPRLPDDCEASTCGTLWLAEDRPDLDALEAKSALLTAAGVAHEMLDGDALQEAEPCLRRSLPGALRVPGDAIVYPPRVAAQLLQWAARDHGLRIRLGVAVRCVDTGRDGRAAGVLLPDGQHIEADWVVNAAGHHALDLMPFPAVRRAHLELTPRKGHLLVTERRPGFCRHQLVEVGYLKSAHASVDDAAHGDASVAFNLQARPNGQLLVGSSRQFGTLQRDVEPPLLRRMLARAHRFVPALDSVRVLRAWTGFRAATRDHLPLIGPLPGHPRCILAGGHEGLGITTSLASAHLVAHHILGRPCPIAPQPYGLTRYTPEAA